MVTLVWLVTGVVVTVKFAEVCPCGTVTEEGTEATDGLLLLSCTVKPPDWAGAVRVTVPVLGLPPTTVLGLRLRLLSDGVPPPPPAACNAR